VQVLDLVAVFSGESRGELKLKLQVKNEAATPGAASALKWEVWLQHHWFAEGEQSLDQPLASRGLTQFEVQLPIAFVRSGSGSAEGVPVEFFVRGVLTARIEGSDQALGFERALRVIAPGAPIWVPAADQG
jgi:hypothetical protein